MLIEFTCAQCGVTVVKRDRLTRPKSRFCGRPCFWQWLSINQRGERHHNWGGGRKGDDRRAKQRRYLEKYLSKYPERNAARIAVHRAKKAGKLKPEPCRVCGDPKTHAHHPDYTKPLEIEWLCQKHHVDAHRTRFPVSTDIASGA